MNNGSYFLKPNIQVEPLFDQWYAWSHLIAPATACRNVSERHLKIMDSYINAPQVHANAVKNPKMLGGPFIDYKGKRVDEIRALRDQTKSQRSALIELSAAIGELDTLLRTDANGFSLQPLYKSVPDALKGRVELVYDLNNNPSYRLIEPLLYKSKYYDESAQSFMLSIAQSDDRPFILSTPRLEDNQSVHLKIPYRHESIDELFRTKSSARTMGYIQDFFDMPAKSAELFQSFFTPQAPRPYQSYEGNGVRWRYFGHACILIETAGVNMLFDPVLSYTYESEISRYTYADLPDKIDYVLITHDHQDHVLLETLLQIRHKVETVIVPRGGGSLQDPSLKLILKNAGFKNAIELPEMDTIEIDKGFIMGLPFLGEHCDLDVRTKIAYLVKLGKHSLLFAADSCNIEPQFYKEIHSIIGDVDALFLGMECDGAPLSWLYGPLLTQKIQRAMDDSRRLAGSNYEQAIDIVNRFNCKDVYVYAMGQEPWLGYVMSLQYTEHSRPIVESNKLISECRSRGIQAERLFGEKEILLNP